MALFSQLDWVILVGVGAFLLFGQGSGSALRQLGRWYGRLVRLKQELIGEFTAAADLPRPTAGRPFTLRQALLESDPVGGRTSGIPVAVGIAPGGTFSVVALAATGPAPSAGMGPETWSFARPSPDLSGVR